MNRNALATVLTKHSPLPPIGDEAPQYQSSVLDALEEVWKASRKQALQDVASRLVCAVAEPGNEWGRGYAQASKDLAQGIEQLIQESAA